MQTALLLCVPLIAAVAAIGVIVGIAQTIVQVQDQNVSFLPKLLVVALFVAIAGATGLALLVELFHTAIANGLRLLGH